MAIDAFAAEMMASFNHLSIADLLEAREQYHVFLTKHPNVVATAIGRYLVRKPGVVALDVKEKPPRTLENSHVDHDKAWPCVLAFVDKWESEEELVRSQSPGAVVPKTLYLADGRAVPVCIVLAPRRLESEDAAHRAIRYPKSHVGGGFPLQVTVQHQEHVATVGCLVTDGSKYYGLTNRHVTGEPGRTIYAKLGGHPEPIGVAASRQLQLSKVPFAKMYPGWPGAHLLVNADVGLVDIDDVNQWRTDVFRVGPFGPLADLNINNLTLAVIDCPVEGFGAGSGHIRGKVSGLFYRYRAVGGLEYVADYLIGPIEGVRAVVQHGDSGAVLCLKRADGLRPFAVTWGAHEFVDSGGREVLGFGLATGLGNVCRLLDVDIVRGWNVDQPYTWGKTGHFKIGFRAADLVQEPALQTLLQTNQSSLGYPNDILIEGSETGTYTADFVPLADVADIIWRTTRPSDESNHFCDIDESDPRVYGGDTLLKMSLASDTNIDVDIWLDFDQKMDIVKPIYKMNRKTKKEELRPREGALPFRVWQMYKQMIKSLLAEPPRVAEFIVAGGTMAHYVGDACQPLHISYLHHGADPSETAVHTDYETTLIDRKANELFDGVDAIRRVVKPGERIAADGKSAAKLVLRLMESTVGRLPPEEVLDVWRSAKGRGKYDAMWEALGDRTIQNIADGAHAMAVIWESAWQHGNGERLTQDQLGAINTDELRALYDQKTFVPSIRLSDKTAYKAVL